MKKIKNINLDLANECSEIKNIEKKISVCNSRITYLDRNDYLIIGLYLHLLEELTLQYRQKKYNELISLIYKTQQDLQQKVNEHRHLEKHIDDIQITKENYLAIKPNWITRIIYRTKTKNWYNKFDHLIEEDSKNRKKLRTLENSIENLKYSLSLLLKNKEYLEEKFEQQNDPGINDENLLTLSSKAKKLLKLIIVIIKYKQIMYNLVNQLTLKKEALSNNVIHLTKNRKLLHNKITAAQRDFSSDPENFPSEKYWMKSNNELHLSSPWSNQKINKIRIQLFWSAMRLHKYFIILAREPIQSNITALTYLLRNNLPENHSINYLSLWQTLFLIVPVISSAFGSMQNLFRHVHQEEIGWLLIDEAGQTIPHHAVGAIWRSKRVIVVGDPFQLEPIVNLPTILSYKLCEFHNVSFLYDLSKQSAQTLSDLSNPFGTSRNNQDDDIWVGAPLIVHRRCLSPIFEVANEIAYHHTMIQATQPSISVLDGIFTKSVWISPNSIPATNLESHWIEHEGKIACYMFDKIINRLLILPPIFIITPFASVEEELNNYIMQKYLYSWAEKLKCNPETLKKHLEEKIGTIHTFQGKQADTVILLLGGNKQGAIEWAARTPNMLNVAITRSKKVVCVIGNFHLWGQQPYFSVLAKNIPIVTDGKTLQQQFFFACKNQDHKSNELIT